MVLFQLQLSKQQSFFAFFQLEFQLSPNQLVTNS